jgi:fibronectin-binding autotransporter adhesin
VARTTSGNVAVASRPAAQSATVNITGPGSLLDVADQLLVGSSGPSPSAFVNVTGGGAIRSAGGQIGYFTGVGTGTKSVTVSGAESSWTNSGDLSFHHGSLSILDGGAVSAASATMAPLGGVADLLVSGANSTYSVAGDQTVAAGTGTATITLADGGRMSVGGQLTLANAADATAILNIGGAEGQAPEGAGFLDAATLAFGPGTARVNFNHTEADYSFGAAMSGAGTINQVAGVTRLTGDSAAFTGPTTVSGGTLLVNNALGDAASTVDVLSGGTLGGTGTIGGDVTVADGGISPGDLGNAPDTLTINGSLTLGAASTLSYNFGQANVEGGPLNDLIKVGGDLDLDGTLNVTVSTGGSFDPGIYRVIGYAGALNNNGLDVSSPDYFVQTSVAQQVNLVNAAGLTLNFWDGAAGARNDGWLTGGDGLWQNAGANDSWTEQTGTVNAPYSDGAFAVFAGTAGTVTVVGGVRAAGMQFATDGYLIEGDDIELTGPQATIRVGDGTADGAGYVATIAANLTGNSGLVKADLGTLVLSGTNGYTGGTAINGGTLRIASDLNLGDAAGGLSFDGGTLHTTADLTTARAVTLAGTGSFLTDGGTAATLTGGISGAGALTKDGAGMLVLASDATQTGGTTITAGTLRVGDGATAGSLAGDVTNNGTLEFSRADEVTFGGAISGTGGVGQLGTGTTILTGNSTYTGGTLVAAGTLQLGDGGTSGAITGDVTNHGTLAFNRSDDVTFGGAIFGTGGIRQIGPGATTLTANNSYAGETVIEGGALFINGDQTAATGATSVNGGGTLGGAGTIGGDVTVADGGTINPGAAGTATDVLTIRGGLSLAATSVLEVQLGQASVAGGALNDLIEVGGDLTLDGVVNVTATPGGSFGPGIYRVISYGGALVDNGLDLGTMPVGSQVTVQTSVANQVNLVNTGGLSLSYWDGDAGPKANGRIDGGDGTWRAGGDDNWTDDTGGPNGSYANGSFPIFAGTAGNVTVQNSFGDVAAAGMQFATHGYTIQGDAITLTGDQATVRVGDGTAAGAGYVATIASELTGSAGLAKTDLGTLVLDGTNSYAGATAVVGGTLAVNGSIATSSSVTVHGGATLAGTGMVAATTLATGGTIAPSGIATLSVSGAYAQAGGATYRVQVDPSSTASGRIAVSGSAALADGAIINVAKTSSAPYVLGTRYTVLTTTSGLSGTFDLAGDTALTAFIGLVGVYDANNAYLVVQQTASINTVGRTPNQIAAGTGVSALPDSNRVKEAVLNLPDEAAARHALDQLSGEIHASAQTATIENSRFVRDAATDRLREAFCGVGAQETLHRDAPQSKGECTENTDRLTVWGRMFGSWGRTGSDGNAGTLSRTTEGFIVGVDAPVLDSWRVGVLAGYGSTSFDVDSRNSSGSSKDYHLGLYGGTQWGALGFRAGASYTWQDISTRRTVSFPGFNDGAGASYQAGMTQLFGDLGYRIDAGRAALEPFANLAYLHLDTEGFAERGGAAALTSPGDTTDTTFTTLGLRASTDFAFGNAAATARGSLGWRHAFGDDTPTPALSFAGGESFEVAGAPIARDAAVLDLGLDLRIAENATVGISYGGQFSTDAFDQSIRGNLSIRF